jgi:AcrR family transcriptional regulator
MAAIDPKKRRVTPPRQERSRATFERILDALEELLRTRRFEDITVRELVERSGTSTGSFYARFPTRETLLPALYDRYDADVHRRARATELESVEEETLEALVAAMMRRIVDRMFDRRWLTRAVALHARLHPEMIPAEQRRRRLALHARWRNELLRHRELISHPDPESAVAFGLFMTVTALREKIVFADAPHASSFELTRAQLAEEATRALLAYLGVDSTAPSNPGTRRDEEA